jgi:prepilin-type N-terminal cleavage/methylation domain-containing protein
MFLIFTREEQRYRRTKPSAALLELFTHSKTGKTRLRIPGMPLFAPDWMTRFASLAKESHEKNKPGSLDERLWSGDIRGMNRRRRRSQKSAFSLVEFMVVIMIIAVLISATFYGIGSLVRTQDGLAVSSDLREINRAQHKAILRGLYNPATLAEYGSPTCPWLQLSQLTDPTMGVHLNTANFRTAISYYNLTTIPPTHQYDGSISDSPKTPGVARSGDGLYDLGHEN